MKKKSSPLLPRFGFTLLILLAFLLGIFLRTPIPGIKITPPENTPQDTSKTKEFAQGTYRVTLVLDGDTIELEDGTRVRYAGVDAPEKNQAYGLSSAKYNQQLVGRRDVLVIPTEEIFDQYGRVLAYVYAGNVFVNEKMIEEGYARLLVFKGKKPEKYDQLKAAEDFARSRHLGVWLEEWELENKDI
ncbi:MAG: hypothetical protein A2900_00610 [Candidatus Chisholmbacteria bacterium RIFCSPLOWO2_01_FULL_50_28]|uniref:TNase-like domain-containing protein n=1 Tax=Candidatus Chisholmbacteria bacterium RIFCSPHIGHO2_01_FULL_52_32 TaxID=1797591 RepID=A0A1G1VRF2_9BACT|nr:MAG: hypothetical protein A2786_00100 [Candidatus Chisholmbacteria bacterium RIFCSPHIGHO2_01_FULL_52_32]OGY19599.1 MAG: hypothetical protein A2900_00610 [Candidatus Chisholmbacteria bacterium RIFCSPLOWO2_01_FULL_50_28]